MSFLNTINNECIFLYRTEDGSRQVDDHLVMYNNPLFAAAREKGKSGGSGNRQLTLDSDWNVVFDL